MFMPYQKKAFPLLRNPTAGFNIVGAFDNWDKAVEIYNKNFNHGAKLIDAGIFPLFSILAPL